ncbi:adenylate/guanylate cyclase domain-containing protein [Leptospira vanthielii]|uniref:Adenylate/guanylate cyclase domain-containing protein n=2 Tax=Leptospira vanthielii TaxID=293085 RepID=A0ABY2NJR5_9LEPT|nr:adenylate/guanylate cyclase domain-containing protein [Leptospira vanthielii]EMY69098.1 adenylate/guanylate cyclase catalytic domain protein [Leptospira vanthielii serovar Holland str. Waz Holland = ATCC 700522]TGM46081.1 adenylate/guanylate cyclase domain-containing protein [Leptospira vanthielii]
MKKLFLIVMLFHLGCLSEERSVKAETKKGYLDLSQHSFSDQPFVALDGEWKFFWNTAPSQIQETDSDLLLNLPKHWNGYKMDYGSLGGFGHASFRIKLKLAEDLHETMALTVLEQDTSYAIYVNGKYLGGSGKPGTNANEYTPQVKSTIVVLPETSNITIDLYVANYVHRKGGIWNDIVLSTYTKAESRLTKRKINETMLSSILTFVGFFFFVMYFYNRDGKHTMGIFLFSVAVLLRTISTGERILLEFVDLPYSFLLRLEYLSWYWSAPLLYHYFYTIFPEDFSKRMGTFFYILSSILTIGLLLPPVYFTETASIYPIAFVANGIIIFIYLYRAYKKKRMESKPLLFGMLLVLVAATNDVLHAESYIHTTYIAPASVVIFVFLQVITFGRIVRQTMTKTLEFAQEQKQLSNSFSRFVPTEFLYHLGKTDIRSVDLGDQVQKRMTILFADIRSFTEFSERLTPKENFDFLNSYLQRVGPIIRHNNGFIDKFIGDAVMALFPYDINDAVKAAVEMQDAIRIYNGHRANCGYIPVEVGIGIHTGNLTLGILGEHKRMEGTVISDAVNLASRIEGITKLFSSRIVISADTFIEASEGLGYHYRLLDRVAIKGKTESVFVVEVLDGYEPEKASRLISIKDDYTLALDAFRRDDFEEAMDGFSKLLDKNPDDSVSRLFLDRCREAKERSKMEFGS